MKFTFDNPTRIFSNKGKVGVITRDILRVRRVMMLIILVIALAACSRPQQGSSGAEGGARATGTPVTPTPSGAAGGAILNLTRSVTFNYSNGSDLQREVGAIKLEFTKTTEDGDLVVEGSGKTAWSESAQFPGCSFTATADGKVSIRGIFSVKDCKFHLTITSNLSTPTTSNQSGNCDFIVFTETEFSSRIQLKADASQFKETKDPKTSWWTVTTANFSDLKSNEVELCFTAEVLE